MKFIRVCRNAAVVLMILAASGCGGGQQEATAPAQLDQNPVPLIQYPAQQIRFNSVALFEQTDARFLRLTEVSTGDTLELFAEVPNVPGIPSNFSSFVSGGGDQYAIVGKTPSGAGWVISGAETIPHQLESLEESTLPDARLGRVQYTGDYVGQYARDDGVTVDFGHMLGDATIRVDFAAGMVEGEITGRANTGRTMAEPITLLPGDFENGLWRGRTEGGQFVGGEALNGGDHIGLVTGSAGEEVIAAIQIRHRLGAAEYREAGSIVATAE
ncbi:hypothetical protein [Yoonia sediminilitoris]|uniref:Transferrin-binding protein B C-lobe/N-lobe beta barrel domain-containing protein n=1 Tax=Yoonia sediminilitoris TaxID=1286148 RepID=A0A2T6K8K6_9RHOB|nr:hypothetical protein [Yoonia sediminilitoris]PUB11039.1 hypothetical protein C8N45_11523 [Yoonia sediminilitoris]RCW90958.1 hypothetical protein DFP92_11523 [Yoonia sediminilitoris]